MTNQSQDPNVPLHSAPGLRHKTVFHSEPDRLRKQKHRWEWVSATRNRKKGEGTVDLRAGSQATEFGNKKHKSSP